MLKKIINHKKETAIVIVLILLLALIRNFEEKLFYDPFLNFFKDEFLHSKIPSLDYFKLVSGLFFRYLLNTIISLGILYVIFKQIDLIKFAGFLYCIFFTILIISFFAIIYFYTPEKSMMLFYVRRFIIQPIFLLLFLPAFYYQDQFLKK
ncbi:exosortase F-associated protein [Flavobacterium arsenatis]|uniref:Exosortase F-associated protein n=1 Tax=Flavobacterium arsenatis TaxID=1484332 RepID=A0ABU1TKB1_9FLAO|nr:exosortase F system-associated protein [Flavobacterium arsenatis]MDR6966237.1 exosortase F-associated protein [Flavobacterium arsenatis]